MWSRERERRRERISKGGKKNIVVFLLVFFSSVCCVLLCFFFLGGAFLKNEKLKEFPYIYFFSKRLFAYRGVWGGRLKKHKKRKMNVPLVRIHL